MLKSLHQKRIESGISTRPPSFKVLSTDLRVLPSNASSTPGVKVPALLAEESVKLGKTDPGRSTENTRLVNVVPWWWPACSEQKPRS